jgi:hypothetical protein
VTDLVTTFWAHGCELVVVDVKTSTASKRSHFEPLVKMIVVTCDRSVSLMGLSPLRMLALRLALGLLAQSVSSIATSAKRLMRAPDRAAAHALSMLSYPTNGFAEMLQQIIARAI